MKTAVFPLLLLPFLCPAQSDTVAVPRDRLVRWAANRALADDMLKERAIDYARARAVIDSLRSDMDEAARLIDAGGRRTDECLEQVALTHDRIGRLEKKVRRRGGWVGVLAIFAALEAAALALIVGR